MHCRVPVPAEHLQVRTREMTPRRRLACQDNGHQHAVANDLSVPHTSSSGPLQESCQQRTPAPAAAPSAGTWHGWICFVWGSCVTTWHTGYLPLRGPGPIKHVFCRHRKPDRPTACACSQLAPCCRQAGRGCPCQCRPMTHPSGAHQIPLRGLGPHHACNFVQRAGQRTPVACLPRAGEPVKGGVQHWPGWRPQRVQHRWQVEGAGKLQVQALCPCRTGRHARKAVQEACRVERGLRAYL